MWSLCVDKKVQTYCEPIKLKGSWRDVADAARTTIHREPGRSDPSRQWRRRMLLAEHSPIRQLIVKVKWRNLPYWVSTHFVRHWLGIVHWVRTQRSDRTGIDRDTIPQGALVEHEFEANAQALINISRKRLCNQASKETREAWVKVLDEVARVDPDIYDVCVPDCIYRGYCYEYETCGYHKSAAFERALAIYRKGINS